MNSDKEQRNEEVGLLSDNDKKEKKNDPKKIFRNLLKVAEVVFVCIVYLLVFYFLLAAETAFASRDSTMDKICSSILACLGIIILPAMLLKYLENKIRNRFFWPGLIICLLYFVWRWIVIYVGIPNMSYVFEYGKLFQ